MNKATLLLTVMIVGATSLAAYAQESPTAAKPEVTVPNPSEVEEVEDAVDEADEAGDDEGNFIPTEKIKIDSAVSFPVDI